MEDHKYFLQKCAEIGEMAAFKGDAPVGALIVLDHRIVGEGAEAANSKNDITCHAEIEALRAAVKNLNSKDLSNCVLYSNYEPCVMCAYAIRYYRIKKVVYQHKVPFLGSISSEFPLLITSNIPDHWAIAPDIIYLPDIGIV
jgi:tRNA(adenine34) deaminase